MIGLIFFATLIAVTSLELASLKNIDISIAFPISFNGIMLILYLFGLFNFLVFGVYIIVFFSVLILFLTIIKRKITLKYLMQQFSSPVIYLWIFSVFLVTLFFDDRLIWMGDDLNHWALVAKNMYFNDRFCIGNNIHIYLTNYPEFNTLPAYLALKLNGSFHEGILYALNILWEIVLLFPFFYKSKIQRIFKNTAAFIFILLMPLFYGFQVMFWNTLQIDIMLGIAFAHCLLLIFMPIKQNEKIMALITGILTLTILKLTGFYLALFVVVLLIVECIQRSKDHIRVEILKEPILLAILSLVGYYSWIVYIKLNGAEIWVNTNRYKGLETVLEFLRGTESAIRYDTLQRAVNRIFSFKYVQIGSMNSYILWIIILIGGIVLLGFIKNKKPKQTMFYCILFVLGFIIWWIGVLFVTIFKFSEEEMLVLSSYDRYLQPYFIGVLFTIFGLLFIECYKRKNIIIFCILLLLFLNTYKTIGFNIGYFFSSAESQIAQRDNIEKKCAEFLKAKEKGLFNHQKDRIYIISQQNGALSADYYDAEFLISPIPVNLLCSYNIPANVNLSYCLGKPYSSNDIWTTDYSVNEFSNVLEGYTYLLILTSDENFQNNYYSMFKNGTVEQGLYSIKRNGTHIMFEHEDFVY